MKILLVTPITPPAGERWMPLGLCYIASMLQRDGHDVRIADRYLLALRTGRDTANRLLMEQVKTFRLDMIGFTTYSPYIFDTVESVRMVRSESEALIVLGGHHATAFPELTLQRIPEADVLIAGEGESAFRLLANGMTKTRVPGLYWRDDGIRHSGTPAKPEDLDNLPLPAYSLLDMAYYTGKNANTIRPVYLSSGSILSSRGCRNRCAFCTESLTFSGKPRLHSPDYVFNNIDVLRNKFGCNGVTFLDNDFLVDRQRAEEILLGIVKRQWNKDTVYCVQARADDLDSGIVKLMKEAGFSKVELGLETSSQASLDRIGKNLKASTSEIAVRLCREYGISVQANLLYGIEGETVADLDATLEWIRKLKVQNVKWGRVMLFPGSLLYRRKGGAFFENNEWTKENIETFFRTDCLSGIPREELNRWVNKRLKPFLRLSCHQGILTHNKPADILSHYSEVSVRKFKGKFDKNPESESHR